MVSFLFFLWESKLQIFYVAEGDLKSSWDIDRYELAFYNLYSGVYGGVVIEDDCSIEERKETILFYFYSEFDVAVYGVDVVGEIFDIIFMYHHKGVIHISEPDGWWSWGCS